MKRGDVVVAIFPGDYGKPRPGVIVQSDASPPTYASLTLCPLTTDIRGQDDIRIRIEPTTANGLGCASEIMVDKIQSVRRDRVRGRVGALDPRIVRSLDTALRVWLGLA